MKGHKTTETTIIAEAIYLQEKPEGLLCLDAELQTAAWPQ